MWIHLRNNETMYNEGFLKWYMYIYIYIAKIEWDLTNGPLRNLLELLDTQVEGSVQWVLLEIPWYIYIYTLIPRETLEDLCPLFWGERTLQKKAELPIKIRVIKGFQVYTHAFCPCFFRGFEAADFFLNRRFTRSYRLRIMAAPTTFQWGSSSHRSELLICGGFL